MFVEEVPIAPEPESNVVVGALKVTPAPCVMLPAPPAFNSRLVEAVGFVFTTMLPLEPDVVMIFTFGAVSALPRVMLALSVNWKVAPAEDTPSATVPFWLIYTLPLPPVLAVRFVAAVWILLPDVPIDPVPDVRATVLPLSEPPVCVILPLPFAATVNVFPALLPAATLAPRAIPPLFVVCRVTVVPLTCAPVVNSPPACSVTVCPLTAPAVVTAVISN